MLRAVGARRGREATSAVWVGVRPTFAAVASNGQAQEKGEQGDYSAHPTPGAA